jgi:hypothetical protein
MLNSMNSMIPGNELSFGELPNGQTFCLLKDWNKNPGVEIVNNHYRKNDDEKAVIIMSRGDGHIAGPKKISIKREEKVIPLTEQPSSPL